jgi:transcriptional regulator with XRE-family HTH domain
MSKKSETVGERLARLRTSISMSREEMARQCGITRASISMWESDATKMSAENLFKVAAFLGVSVHELWFGRPARPEDALPEFERVRIKSQERLKAQALQWLDDVKQVISELEPRSHGTKSDPPQKRPRSKSKKEQ